MDLTIIRLAALIPVEPFGRVAKAMDVVDPKQITGDFRIQLIHLPAGQSFEPHLHVSEHIIIVLEGTGTVAAWDSVDRGGSVEVLTATKRVRIVSRGDMVFIPKDLVHQFAASVDEGLKEVIINVPGIDLHDERRIVWV